MVKIGSGLWLPKTVLVTVCSERIADPSEWPKADGSSPGIALPFHSPVIASNLRSRGRRTELSASAGHFQNHIGGSFRRTSDFGEACLPADFGEPLFACLSAKAEADFLG